MKLFRWFAAHQECGPPLPSALLLTLSRLRIYFNRLIDRSWNHEETQVFPKLNLLTNHIRLVLDMQIILPPWELQVYVAKDNSILRDGYVQFHNCSVVLFMIGFLSFISKINCTVLPCLFFGTSFRCCREEFPRRYRSCLLSRCNISRLAVCLVLIELKLRRFHVLKIRCVLQVSHEYFMSIS